MYKAIWLKDPTNGTKAGSDESARQQPVSVWRTEPKFTQKSPAGLQQNVEEPTAELSTEQRASLPVKRTVGDDWEKEIVIRGTTLQQCEVNKEPLKCLPVKSSNLVLFIDFSLSVYVSIYLWDKTEEDNSSIHTTSKQPPTGEFYP